MQPTPAPACPVQAPSTFPSARVVPWQQDSKRVIKLNEPGIGQCSPIHRMTPTSSALLSPIQPCLSRLLPAPEKDGILPKMGERQLVSTAVKNVIMSIAEHSPQLKTKPTPHGDKQDSVCSILTTPFAHRKVRLTMPTGGDRACTEATCGQSHAPHLKVAPRCCVSSLFPSNLEMVIPECCSVISYDTAKSMRKAHVPSALTVPSLSMPPPACPMQAISPSCWTQSQPR